MDYMLRRHLNTTRAEVRAKPWWEHDLIMEGLGEEFAREGDDGEATEIDGSTESLLSHGFNVKRVE